MGSGFGVRARFFFLPAQWFGNLGLSGVVAMLVSLSFDTRGPAYGVGLSYMGGGMAVKSWLAGSSARRIRAIKEHGQVSVCCTFPLSCTRYATTARGIPHGTTASH